jgi:hypothetical protein
MWLILLKWTIGLLLILPRLGLIFKRWPSHHFPTIPPLSMTATLYEKLAAWLTQKITRNSFSLFSLTHRATSPSLCRSPWPTTVVASAPYFWTVGVAVP